MAKPKAADSEATSSGVEALIARLKDDGVQAGRGLQRDRSVQREHDHDAVDRLGRGHGGQADKPTVAALDLQQRPRRGLAGHRAPHDTADGPESQGRDDPDPTQREN